MEPVLKITNLLKRYNDFSLSNINFEIRQGSIVGLVGENGAGKTTLLSLILNQRRREDGQIEIFGKDNIEYENDIKQNIGFYNDESFFHSCFTAKNINSIMKSIYKKWNKTKYLDYLKQFKVPLNKKIKDMSKGTKSKLMIAISLSYSPSLLIFDEITSGLDPIVRNTILQILKDYVKSNCATVFFSTHITSDLEDIADEFLVLHEGKIAFRKSVDDLHRNYVIYECDLQNYNSLPKKGMERILKFDHKCVLLVKSDYEKKEFFREKRVPLIDDIMHFYIEGEACL
ncbi:ABC transporter ATP-binding protein [Clostridium sp. E02]|uniref:ABC transporter ATP-binding protein n=1 Tax=Clostridium sp. E02 TaxID=2487134 RepID=UPI000F535B69|nr:ABC transporter ATP-binding protein [Clostridium sp. E02]